VAPEHPGDVSKLVRSTFQELRRIGVGWLWARLGISSPVLCLSRPDPPSAKARYVRVQAQMSPPAHSVRVRVTRRSSHVGRIAEAMEIRSSHHLVPGRACSRGGRARRRHCVGRDRLVVRVGGPLHKREDSRWDAGFHREEPPASPGAVTSHRIRPVGGCRRSAGRQVRRDWFREGRAHGSLGETWATRASAFARRCRACSAQAPGAGATNGGVHPRRSARARRDWPASPRHRSPGRVE
jgi:hypothetical protein